ncbi:MAG: hypothetical protein ACYTAS_04820 [Planctomycetota bacterium]|jgi:hypothetical protein
MIAVYIALGVVGCAIAILALLRTSKNERDIKALKASMEAKDKS